MACLKCLLVTESACLVGSLGVCRHGTLVAIKTMVIPAAMSRSEHEQMVVMEAAISTSLAHPNIVQVSDECRV